MSAVISEVCGESPSSAVVTALSLTDFRSYAHSRLVLDGRSVVLTGENGAGKTNVLEALSFLAPGRGLRRARLAEVTRVGASSGWAVAATLRAPHVSSVPVKMGTGLGPGPDEGGQPAGGHPAERRTVRIDGETQSSAAALSRVLSVAWLTPEMDRLFGDGASGRRRFFDRLVVGIDPGHSTRVNAYEKVMRDRVRLLRDAQGGGDRAWLDALEASMAEHGVAVAAARREALARLSVELETRDGAFPRAVLALDGVLENRLAEQAAVDVEDEFRAMLADGRQRDADAGRALNGPHRTDLLVWHGGTEMAAAACSTGQQKALLIAVILANARVLRAAGAAPLLLLDEVVAHLDERRRAALFDEIEALNAQAWLTGTDSGTFTAFGERAQHFSVSAGEITENV